ncbi:hypothetical protein P8452_70343 [Trifolium repens]|nr:hypothetical protein P8452_70343 [Trifolium repens]
MKLNYVPWILEEPLSHGLRALLGRRISWILEIAQRYDLKRLTGIYLRSLPKDCMELQARGELDVEKSNSNNAKTIESIYKVRAGGK